MSQYQDYLEALKTDFIKIAKLDFLNPDMSVAFSLDNNARKNRSKAFLQNGTLSCNLQNGRRRQASVTIANVDGEFEYAVNHIWFGQQIRLSEGLILPNGDEFYIPQGIFEIDSPEEAVRPNERTVIYNLVDKWANLDGTLLGNLEDVYEVDAGTNIFAAIASLLKLGRYDAGNNSDYPIDNLSPIFTNYYNDKTQTLQDGTVVPLIEAPYDYISDASGTYADVVLGLAEMLAAWVGYNSVGRLVIDPSQDDINDAQKPIEWEFRMDEKQLVSINYKYKNTEVFNDVIIVGATSDDNGIARGRAQNTDPKSDTCISRIGLKTKRIEMPNYYSDDICQDYADWLLKRYSILQKTVTIETTQMFHIQENNLVTIQRADKLGSPLERHIVQGFSRPIGQTGTMTIDAVSVKDIPNTNENVGVSAIAGIAIPMLSIVGKVYE